MRNAVNLVLKLAVVTSLVLLTVTGQAQTASVKNNLLYDLTLTPNIGLEVKTGEKTTMQVFYGLNPWKYSDTKSFRHWSLMPEFRYWTQETFRGHFLGLHAFGGEYNIGGVGLIRTIKDNRYEGWYAGGGLTYGYAWRIARHWNLEAALGIGFVHVKYDKYVNEVCGQPLACGHKNYVGPTKLALNIAYLLGVKDEVVLPPPPVVIEEPHVEYVPQYQLAFATPAAEAEKTREYSGKAFLDFPVNKTDIRPDYRRNREELDKVMKTIDIVRQDPNTSITHISIHGYASPEGSYQSNARLAEGRAQAFKEYIRRLINLSDDHFSVASTPEDWDGLKAALAQPELSALSAQLSAVIGSSLSEDQKEQQLKRQFPAEWKQLLADVFPALRHSDYVVQYAVRPFTVAEARDIIKTKPQQLSLNEMFLVAQEYEPGSQDYNDVFETAVRMFPDDPTANLNAAVIAMQRNDLDSATRFLARAGNSPEAANARGILAARTGDRQAAEALFRQALPLAEARHNLDELLHP